MCFLDWLRSRWLEALLVAVLAAAVSYFIWLGEGLLPRHQVPESRVFSGAAALQHVSAQVDIGPRPAGSEASRLARGYIINALTSEGWGVITQTFDYQGAELTNVVARTGDGPIVMIGAHYDTRAQADADPDESLRQLPVIGANDGASGVAVLLELANALDLDQIDGQVWLAFFDAEDNGRLGGWEWAVGSSYMASQWADGLNPLEVPLPEVVIIVDMIGDADQRIYLERNSTPGLANELWGIAADLGYGEYLIPEEKWSITDDHTPFLEIGVQAVDIIDFDYPYYHTTQDTLDKVSADSLERVGRVLEHYLEQGRR